MSNINDLKSLKQQLDKVCDEDKLLYEESEKLERRIMEIKNRQHELYIEKRNIILTIQSEIIDIVEASKHPDFKGLHISLYDSRDLPLNNDNTVYKNIADAKEEIIKKSGDKYSRWVKAIITGVGDKYQCAYCICTRDMYNKLSWKVFKKTESNL